MPPKKKKSFGTARPRKLNRGHPKQRQSLESNGTAETTTLSDDEEDRRQSLESNGTSDAASLNANHAREIRPDDNMREPTAAELDEELKDNLPLLDESRIRRLTVAYIFKNKYNLEEQRTLWEGKGQIVAGIRKFLCLDRNYPVKPILEDVLECRRKGIPYEGNRRVTQKLGRKPIISIDSIEAQIIADAIEDYLGIRSATQLVNEHRKQQNLVAITKSAVEGLIKRLNPMVQKVERKKQGSGKGVDTPWARARNNWVTQLLIRLGEVEWKPEKEGDPTPDYFNKAKLEEEGLCFDAHQYGSWDETHTDCTPGEGGIAGDTKESFLRFRRRRVDSQEDAG
jgi:hypothetical protein